MAGGPPALSRRGAVDVSLLFLWLGLLGVGLGTYIPANNMAIMATVPPQQAAAAGGMVNMARGLGTALGVAVVHGAGSAGGGFPQAGNR
jgi:hypothetical protein